MSSAKEKHYWSQLRSALTAGQWLAEFPAKTPQGAQLSWSELFRKFNKHCKGFSDVAELASQNYALALLLANSSTNEDEDYAGVRDFSIELGGESLLPPERIEEALVGYETLKSLQSGNSDSLNFALAYYAYAIGKPEECLAHLAQVPDFSQIQSFIPSTGTTRSSTSNLLTVPGGAPSASSSITGGFSSFTDPAIQEVRDGRGWALTETFRSLCLQGMCHERLFPDDPRKALRAYHAALPAFKVLQSQEFASLIAQPTRLSSGKLDYTSFVQLRELWRWVERLLFRAISLSSRVSNDEEESEEDSLWVWLEKYTVCSASWPPTFRTEHRATISSIYLRALIVRHGVQEGPIEKAPMWLGTARSVVQDYRAILNVSTKFPRAGERNVKVEEFVDLCVAVWEACGAVGEHANWVLDILWWATRLTFNSSRVLRHMTRILYLSGDTNLAKRSLRLYIQVVSKAWQASKQGAGDSIDPDDNDSIANTEHHGYLEDTDSDVHWVETLVFGARMLCSTASLSPGTKDVADVKEARDILEKAKTRTSGLDARLRAEIALAEGIVDSVLAIKCEDHLARPSLLESAHKHILESITIHSLPAAHFQLALSFARAGAQRDIEQAIQHAGLAAESSPKEIRYWHLLALLLTATERWDEADTIFAHGAEIDPFAHPEEVAEPIPTRTGSPDGTPSPEGTDAATNGDATITPRSLDSGGSPRQRRQSKNFALNINLNGDNLGPQRTLTMETITPVQIDRVGRPSVLPFDAKFVPPSGQLLRSILDPVSPSKKEVFEWGLQLRMSWMALTEVQQGPEGAEVEWVKVFGWIAEKRGLSQSTPTTTTEGSQRQRASTDVRQSLDIDRHVNMSTISISHLNATTVESRNGNTHATYTSVESIQVSVSSTSNADPNRLAALELAAPPPITISPASPEVAHHEAGTSYTDSVAEHGRNNLGMTPAEKKGALSALGRARRSSSLDRDKGKGGEASASKKMQQILIKNVQKGQMRISAVGRRIGNEITKNGLRRSNSTPDFHAALQSTSYQASSIHSRRRLSSIIHSEDRSATGSPTPPPPAPSPLPQPSVGPNSRSQRESRLLSDLWLMSAATFRRLSKVDQAKGAIQEGEVRDENNPNVWIQLALYYDACSHRQHAISTLQKALFIDPHNVSATVHLSRLYLTPPSDALDPKEPSRPSQSNVDLACGLLTHLSKGRGWDVPEVWYYLAMAYRLQGRAEREAEALEEALRLSEGRGVREIGAAVGLCI